MCLVRVVYEGASAYEVQVQVADSAGGPWSTAATDENPGWLGSKSGGGIAWTQTTYLPLLPPTTHVRLAILSAATVYGVKAYSVELYGQGAFPPPTAPPPPPRPPTAPPCIFSSASMMDHAAVADSLVSASDSEPGTENPRTPSTGRMALGGRAGRRAG